VERAASTPRISSSCMPRARSGVHGRGNLRPDHPAETCWAMPRPSFRTA
jgi:hypothetical protein